MKATERACPSCEMAIVDRGEVCPRCGVMSLAMPHEPRALRAEIAALKGIIDRLQEYARPSADGVPCPNGDLLRDAAAEIVTLKARAEAAEARIAKSEPVVEATGGAMSGTPRPWRAEQHTNGSTWGVYAEDDEPVVWECGGCDEGDARMIAHHVNAYEKMVEALRRMRGLCCHAAATRLADEALKEVGEK